MSTEQYLNYRKNTRRLSQLAEKLEDAANMMRRAAERMRLSDGKIDVEVDPSISSSLQPVEDVARTVLNKGLINNVELRGRMSYHEYVEMTDVTEYKKFQGLKPISPEEIQLCDFEMLFDRLAAVES